MVVFPPDWDQLGFPWDLSLYTLVSRIHFDSEVVNALSRKSLFSHFRIEEVSQVQISQHKYTANVPQSQSRIIKT